MPLPEAGRTIIAIKERAYTRLRTQLVDRRRRS
jgi:hypothetical protein